MKNTPANLFLMLKDFMDDLIRGNCSGLIMMHCEKCFQNFRLLLVAFVIIIEILVFQKAKQKVQCSRWVYLWCFSLYLSYLHFLSLCSATRIYRILNSKFPWLRSQLVELVEPKKQMTTREFLIAHHGWQPVVCMEWHWCSVTGVAEPDPVVPLGFGMPLECCSYSFKMSGVSGPRLVSWSITLPWGHMLREWMLLTCWWILSIHFRHVLNIPLKWQLNLKGTELQQKITVWYFLEV